MMAPPPGQHDYSAIYLTRHALERFAERFGGDAEPALRAALSRTRKLGTNKANGALAVMALHGDRPLVAILQDDACITVLTWPQFEPRLAEFGRPHTPRKWGRWLGRLKPGNDPAAGG